MAGSTESGPIASGLEELQVGQTDQLTGMLAWGIQHWEPSVIQAPKMDAVGSGGQSEGWRQKEEP